MNIIQLLQGPPYWQYQPFTYEEYVRENLWGYHRRGGILHIMQDDLILFKLQRLWVSEVEEPTIIYYKNFIVGLGPQRQIIGDPARIFVRRIEVEHPLILDYKIRQAR